MTNILQPRPLLLCISSLFLILSFGRALAQKPANAAFEKDWQLINSFVADGRPASAAEIAQKILTAAQRQGNGPQAIKAQLFLMGVDETIQENATVRNIRRIDSLIEKSSGAEKALWQSINGELYWSYYQRNRWTILGRTPLAGPPPADLAVWDAASLIGKASDLYLASIAEDETLKAIPVERYAPLLAKGKNTRHLRPSLYDFLAFRAIDFFENDEKDVIKPAYQFRIDGTFWFRPASQLAAAQIRPAQPEALHFRALQTYQQLLAFHLGDEKPDALIDADLHRLGFVHRFSVHPQKDSLYLDALRSLEAAYPQSPAIAQVSYQIIQFLYDKRSAGSQKKTDLAALKRQLDGIAARFPNTEGAANALRLARELSSPVLSVQAEEVVLPHENSKVLITYRNLNKVYIRLYKTGGPLDFGQSGLKESERKSLLQTTPILSMEQALPASEDHEEHRTELKIQPLAPGAYVLVASASADFQSGKNILHATPFQVSAISMVTNDTRNSKWLLALHRKSGKPLAGAKAVFWVSQWDAQNRAYRHNRLGEVKTDAEGKAQIKSDPGKTISRITLVHGDDSVQIEGYYPVPRHVDRPAKTIKHLFFFTDRAIYRPGQSIYFKGILLEEGAHGGPARVLPNERSTLSLYSVNGEKLSSLELSTNNYGSFSGSFTAPEGGLTGQMRLGNELGWAYFSVEEYKRPKFQVKFDSLKASIALGEQVLLRGQAQAYTGTAIGGAQVRYRVLRRTRFPFFWAFYRWGQPRSLPMEITNGTVKTAADGSFEVPFTAVPDEQIDPGTLPIFSYVVYADVTDVNGETRSSNVVVYAGYRSLEIIASADEQIDMTEPQKLMLSTRNLNGVAVPADVTIAISRLRAPGKLYRKRLWEKPDQHLMPEAEFRAAFPEDEYEDESDYLKWPQGEVIWETSVNTGSREELMLPSRLWKQEGWHVIELKTRDAQGNDIIEKKYVYAVNTKGRTRPQMPLLVFANKGRLEPGETLNLLVKTQASGAHVLESTTDMQAAYTAFHSPKQLKRLVTEKDRGGMEFSWLYVYNNRVYTTSHRVEVPWSDRELRLEWASHRDKLMPGEAEEWRLTIKGHKKEALAAEVLAGLYDASLDALKGHQWRWNRFGTMNRLTGNWGTRGGFGSLRGLNLLNSLQTATLPDFEKRYDALDDRLASIYPGREIMIRGSVRVFDQNAPAQMKANLVGSVAGPALQEVAIANASGAQKEEARSSGEVPLRRNLQETAFFMPHLQTDAEGNVSLAFTMPEALTEWRFMAFAHTADWKTGYLEGAIKTQKDLMVVPNLPRFLRQGDDIRVSSKINNISAGDLQGVAKLELLDALTMRPLSGFGDDVMQKDFSAAAAQSTTVDWLLRVPDEQVNPVVLRITARAGNFTDGEENTLPVLSNRMLVTETLPLAVRGNESKAFRLEKLAANKSETRVNHALTLEFTGNPAWYAVQALPFLSEGADERADVLFNRFYANALAAHIVEGSPRLKSVFERWAKSDSSALLSNLEKNQDLKSALLEETPWLREARSESEQKRRIAQLFESHKLAQGLEASLTKLAALQLPEGAFPWFRGMMSNRYMTQYIATGMARLRHLGVEAAGSVKARRVLSNALGYLDSQIKADYERLLENKAKLKEQQIGHLQVQYLYLRSFRGLEAVAADCLPAYTYFLGQGAAFWPAFNPYMKGHLALALQRAGKGAVAGDIMVSLRETAIRSEEMGMYWKSMPRGYWWYEAPVEAQALLIEAFTEVAGDAAAREVDDLKVWLLKQKQTQYWNTSKATADAIYALLLRGSDWLAAEPAVTVSLGEDIIRSGEIKTEAGTGYFRKRYEGTEVKADMGNISVKLDKAANEGLAWGAVYWQYFEDIDKISSAETPLSLRKQLFIERNSDKGPVLEEIKAGNPLKVGDKVMVRIELRAERDMEFVHLKDMRAACFEPVNVLSGYRYRGGLGYYESTRDATSNFFFDHLRKGTYVFEYPVFVAQSGDFSNGISTIQCMYAPEFSSHSEGMRVKVEE